MNRMITILAVFMMTVLGCSQRPNSLTDGEGFYISVPPIVSLYEPFRIEVLGGKTTVLSWGFVDEMGNPIESPCPYNHGLYLEGCISELPGETKVIAEIEDSMGNIRVLEAKVDIIDPNFARDQSPKIVLDIKDAGTNDVLATVATFRELEGGEMVFSENQDLVFDFSRTRDDEDALNRLTFEVNFGTGFQNVGSAFATFFGRTGVYSMKVRVTDRQENASEKAFVVFVKCSDVGMDPLTIDVGNVQITPDSINNYFTFDATGAVSGGKAPYRFKWDFNGDGLFDPISEEEEWTEETATSAYTIHGGVRQIKLKVWDGCNNIATATVTQPFDIPFANVAAPDGIPGTLQGPQVPGYFFLHGDVRGKDGNSAPAANTDYMASLKIGLADEPRWVECDYEKIPATDGESNGSSWAMLTITGLTQYDSPGLEGTRQGLELNVSDIYDPNGVVNPDVNDKDAFVHRGYYFTDEGGDAMDRQVYKKTDDCTFDINVIPVGPAITPCGNGAPDAGEYGVILDGTFSCTNMESEKGDLIDVTNGAFYCEVEKVDACIGGGGGGGGGIQPIPQ